MNTVLDRAAENVPFHFDVARAGLEHPRRTGVTRRRAIFHAHKGPMQKVQRTELPPPRTKKKNTSRARGPFESHLTRRAPSLAARRRDKAGPQTKLGQLGQRRSPLISVGSPSANTRHGVSVEIQSYVRDALGASAYSRPLSGCSTRKRPAVPEPARRNGQCHNRATLLGRASSCGRGRGRRRPDVAPRRSNGRPVISRR